MVSFSQLPLVLGLAAHAVHASVVDQKPSACLKIPKPNVPGAEVVSIKSGILNNGAICEVNVTLSHHNAKDSVLVQTWLPVNTWNNRFAAIGGGAWLAGQLAVDLAGPSSQGYAVSSTDAGLTNANPYTPAGWALNKDGSVNTALLTNFASRSIHDMAVVGKAVTASFYGKKAKHSYWNGCSTGGRQGLVAAQQFPHDFDGIAAGSPATFWTRYVVGELWPQVVMKEAGYYPQSCEFETVVAKAVEACDTKDRVKDGVLADPFSCKFDPFTLVGTQIECGEAGKITISAKTAQVIRKIWDGPKTSRGESLWFGMPIGSSLNPLAYATPTNASVPNGPNPFFLAAQWVQYFVKQDPKFDVTALTTSEFAKIFAESNAKWEELIGSANPDLSAFKAAGGKLVAWHGLADQLIPPQGTVKYLEDVEHRLGAHATSEFFRLFLAPGVDHCGLGAGPPFPAGAPPVDPFAALVSWVEDGEAPDSLDAKTASSAPSQFTRKICRYPLKAKYRGCGDTKDAASYTCV